MKLPIIIFHIGNQKYLELTINQVQKYNNEVILIGDEHNKHLCENHYNYNKTQNHYNTEIGGGLVSRQIGSLGRASSFRW